MLAWLGRAADSWGAAMDETGANWWMDAKNRWRRGRPPAGWWRSEDGRWHAPDESQEGASAAYRPPAHPPDVIRGYPSPKPVRRRRWLRRIFYVVLAIAAVVALSFVVAAVLGDRSAASDRRGITSTMAWSTADLGSTHVFQDVFGSGVSATGWSTARSSPSGATPS